MNLFKTFKLNWWQAGVFKLSTVSFGIIIGIYWRDFFAQYLTLLWIIMVISALWIIYIWYNQK